MDGALTIQCSPAYSAMTKRTRGIGTYSYMTGALKLMLGTAATSALMSLVLIVLFSVWLVRLFSSRTSLHRKVHDLVLLAAYALFPVQVVTNLLAFAGTLGDGNTSMFRSIEL